MNDPLHGVQYVGIPGYRREHYVTLRKLFADGYKLPATYDQWLEKAEHLVAQYTSQGKTVVKAYIDPDHFPAWCRSIGLNIDAQARIRLAGEAARRQALGEH